MSGFGISSFPASLAAFQDGAAGMTAVRPPQNCEPLPRALHTYQRELVMAAQPHMRFEAGRTTSGMWYRTNMSNGTYRTTKSFGDRSSSS